MAAKNLESTLIVFQNPEEGCREAFDDWYTNIHIRDAMRLDTAIATQRFIEAEEQLEFDGKRVVPTHWAHTIYEWTDAAKCLQDHLDRVCTPLMEVSRDGRLTDLREYFGRAAFMSHGWSEEQGFRRGTGIMTAMIKLDAVKQRDFVKWFREKHAPAVLASPGFESAALFELHEVQVLPPEFQVFAHYGLNDRHAALGAWRAAYKTGSNVDLASQCEFAEVTCWQPRTPRLRPQDVSNPSPEAAAEEARARIQRKDRFLTRKQLAELEFGDENALS